MHELFGLGVAVMGRRVFIKTKVGRGGSHRRGDNVPTRTALAQVIQRTERTRQVVGFAVGGTGRGNQADTLGDCRNGRQPGHRFEADPQTLPAAFSKGRRVGKENRIELFPLGTQRQLLVIADIHGRLRH